MAALATIRTPYRPYMYLAIVLRGLLPMYIFSVSCYRKAQHTTTSTRNVYLNRMDTIKHTTTHAHTLLLLRWYVCRHRKYRKATTIERIFAQCVFCSLGNLKVVPCYSFVAS